MDPQHWFPVDFLFKFTALATVQGGIKMWEGGHCGNCTGLWKLMYGT
jgi:hypothetical protein